MVTSFMKALLLIGILLVSLIFRFTLAQQIPDIILTADSYGYYDIGKSMLTAEFLPFFFNDHRTPLYPLLVSGIMATTGNLNAPVGSYQFAMGAQAIVIVQMLLGLGSIVLFWNIVHFFPWPKWLQTLATLLVAIHPTLLVLERTMLTETLAVTLLLATTLLALSSIKTPQIRTFVALFFLSLALFLLRPAFAGLPIMLYLLFLIFDKQTIKPITITIVSYSAFVCLYIFMNASLHIYKGINHISDINLLGRILKNDIPVLSARNVPFFYEAVVDYRARGQTDPMPYRFLETYDPSIYANAARLNDLQRFVRIVIFSELPAYIIFAFRDIPFALLEFETSSNKLGMTSVYALLQPFNLLVIPLVFLFILRMIKTPSQNTYLMFIGSILTYGILTSVLLGYGEFARLLLPVQPLLYIFIIESMMVMVKNRLPNLWWK